jgi:DNA-3-methyladenine glycosylase II
MRIPVAEPFDFERTLRFILSPPALLNGRVFDPLLDHFEEGEYRRVAEVNGQPVLYGVAAGGHKPSGTRRKPTFVERAKPASGGTWLEVRILAGPADTPERQGVADLVRRQFSTDLDLRPFYRQVASDPVLSRLVRHFRGMRIPQAPAVFETLISAIIEQQVNLSFAHQVKKALIRAYGPSIEFEGRTYYTFPEPASLAITTPAELRTLQVSGPKARYIIELSRAALDGRLDLEALREIEPAQAHERLLREKGVGHWTAQYVGLRALGHLDCLPAGDVGLQKVVRRLYGLRKQPTPARIEKLARSWAGWRSYATFYLWLVYWESNDWKDALAAEIRQGRSHSTHP